VPRADGTALNDAVAEANTSTEEDFDDEGALLPE
jgi:hypothetical protein